MERSDDAGTVTFKSPWVLRKIILVISVAFAIIFGLRIANPLTVWVICGLFSAPFLLARGRKTVLSPHAITYFPNLGRRRTFQFPEIASITPAFVREESVFAGILLQSPWRRHAAPYQFSNGGETVAIPLEYRNHDKVLDAITIAWKNSRTSREGSH